MAIEPVTREERFLAAAGGQSVTPPTPITRKEQLLQGIIDAVKSGGATPDVIENAVNKYLDANPVKPGATTEQAAQIEQNKTDIAGLQTEIDNKQPKGDYVKTVNGNKPDANGNVVVATGGNVSGENTEQAVYVLALSEDEADAQANSDAITAAVAEHKNVILQAGEYPVVPGFVVESGTLDLNGARLRSVAYKHDGSVAILRGERPVICGGTLIGTYDTADNEDGYAFYEKEMLIMSEGVNDALIRDMELRNCWGYAIRSNDGIVSAPYFDTGEFQGSGDYYYFKCAAVEIPDGCKYVTAAGGVGYHYIISDRIVKYRFYDSEGNQITTKAGVPRFRVPIPAGAATVEIYTYKEDFTFRPFYAYFTNYQETLTVENTNVYYCHSLAMANMCGPTVVSKCRFVGMGKPRPDAASTTRGTTGGIDIEDVQTPELIMSDCHAEDCMNLLLYGGYNAVVTNCTGAIVRTYRGWRLHLDNCNISLLDIQENSCHVITRGCYAGSLKIDENAHILVSGDISTSALSSALTAFDHFYADINDPIATSAWGYGVYRGKVDIHSNQNFRNGGIAFAPGSQIEMRLFIADGNRRYRGAEMAVGDVHGLSANFGVFPNGHTIADSSFNIDGMFTGYTVDTQAVTGCYKKCTIDLVGGAFFREFSDRQSAPAYLVFEDCIINNADYYLIDFMLYAGSILEFRGCTIADQSKIVSSGADKITIKITDGNDGENVVKTYHAIGILGDSYSAFDGWIPDGYQPSYGVDNYNGITSVRQMWWWILAKRIGTTILRNSSYSGSTICNTGYNGADATETSYLTRAAADFGASKALEPKPDLIIIFGGTNDDWAVTALGEAKYADWTADDLKTVAPAFCKLISDLTEYNPGADIVFVLNTGMGAEITAKFKEICTHYSVLCVELSDIDKTSSHPSVTGMAQIATQIQAALGQSGNNSGGEDTGGDSGGDTGGGSDGDDSGSGDGLTVISTETFNWDVTTAADIPYETHEVNWLAGDTIRVEYNCLTEGGDPGSFYAGVNYQNGILKLTRDTSGEFVLTEDVTELATYIAKCDTTPAAVEVIITQLRAV